LRWVCLLLPSLFHHFIQSNWRRNFVKQEGPYVPPAPGSWYHPKPAPPPPGSQHHHSTKEVMNDALKNLLGKVTLVSPYYLCGADGVVVAIDFPPSG
jgi:hypothetical protein